MSKLERNIAACLSVLVLLSSAEVWAEVKLPSLFSDGMVLQRDIAIPVWGTAEAWQKVTVEFAGSRKSVTATEDGRWDVRLPSQSANDTPQMLTVSGGNTITIRDVLIGDVWLCSGQSNMAWPVSRAKNAEKEAAKSRDPFLRHFGVSSRSRPREPITELEGTWMHATPENTPKFSASAYFFGRTLRRKLDVPIGLINSSWGGTRIEAWISHERLKDVVEKTLYDGEIGRARAYDLEKVKAQYKVALERWNTKRRADIKAGKKPGGRRPRMNAGQNFYGALYNGMIRPLEPYAIRGGIWYQGEANTKSRENAIAYRKLLPTMITDWRTRWGQGKFPFFFVQLPNFNAPTRFWPEIRESFTKSLELPATGMAITIDVGEAKNIHPGDKQTVGYRLAMSALQVAYGKDVVGSGPLYASMRSSDGSIRLSFSHTGAGLEARGGALKGFQIAGADKQFVEAVARIDGNEVVVSCDSVRNPVAVRYAWKDNPVCNLYNREGIPASPFRTDEWPLGAVER